MNVTVRFFASLREAAGRDALDVALREPTLAALRMRLADELDPPACAALAAPGVQVAVNQTIARGDAALADGDEVAFLPPVTGG